MFCVIPRTFIGPLTVPLEERYIFLVFTFIVCTQYRDYRFKLSRSSPFAGVLSTFNCKSGKKIDLRL